MLLGETGFVQSPNESLIYGRLIYKPEAFFVNALFDRNLIQALGK
jgi:hypothetical protein